MHQKTISILIGLCIILIYCTCCIASPLPKGTPGTRVVPASLPSSDKPLEKEYKGKEVSQTGQILINNGIADVSKYNTPYIDNTLLKNAADTWTLGILGGDRAHLMHINEIFKGSGVSDNEITQFVVLRESLYPASLWATGQAKIKEYKLADNGGVDAELYMPDIEKLITEAQNDISKKYQISDKIARILAEWYFISNINKTDYVKNIEYYTINKLIPVNAYGRIIFGKEALVSLLTQPEKNAIEVIDTVRKYKISWAEQYVQNIKFIVSYSGSLKFSDSLRNVLGL